MLDLGLAEPRVEELFALVERLCASVETEVYVPNR